MDIKPKAIDDKRAHTIKGKLSTRLQLNLNLEERFSQYFFFRYISNFQIILFLVYLS